jgi:hypothetical protein
MSVDNLADYLRDLGFLLREKAADAKFQREATAGGEDEDLKLGRLMAYHEVLSLIRDQAVAFGIELKTVGLEDFDPERDLL